MATVTFECRNCHNVWHNGPVTDAFCPQCGCENPIIDWDEEFDRGSDESSQQSHGEENNDDDK